MKSNLGMAKRFCNTDRYIDDLLALNNKKFEDEIVNIYPPELTLKQTTESDTTLWYLDVSISICQGNFITEVFDKCDNFNFDIVNYLLNLHTVCIFHSSLELVESVINLIVLLRGIDYLLIG